MARKGEAEQVVQFLRTHKTKVAIGLIVVLAVLYFLFPFTHFTGIAGTSTRAAYEAAYIGKSLSVSEASQGGGSAYKQGEIQIEEEKLFVRTGSVSIESKNAEGDAETIKGKVQEFGGFVEQYNIHETTLEKRVHLELRVPSSNFEALFYWILENFNVKSSNIKLYTIDVTLTRTEVDILEDALKDFEELKERAKEGEITAELIDVISKIVEKEVYFQEKLARYAHSYAESKNRSEYATLNVEIVEKKPVPLFDKDFWREFWLGVKRSIERIFEALKGIVLDIPAYAFELLGIVLYWVLTLSATVFVLLVVYRVFLFMKRKIIG